MALFDNNINGAFLQLVMGILITLLLQMLCMNGLSFFSWIIVFLPLVFYTYMTLLLYNIFGKGEDLDDLETKDE
tara:strand:- start:14216 stop:14437 length:222 start_codon:yes stop_codon:yes gene_type:complete